MSQDYSKNEKLKPKSNDRAKVIKLTTKAAIYVGWVAASFFIAQQLTALLIRLLLILKVPLGQMGEALLNTVFSVVIYLVTISIAIGLPWLIKKYKTSRKEIGLDGLPVWMDIWTAPAGFVIYMIFSVVLSAIATALLPWFDVAQQQNVGFSGLNLQYEYILAFLTLVVIAPVAEEVLFRGYLFGKLRRLMPLWVAVILTSLTFGIIHGAWNLALDTFALSVVLCSLRVITGSLWAPILLHMLKNSIAFYILFINPALFNTLGG